MVCGIVLKVWGCITTCEDRLVIYQIAEEKTTQCYYIVHEKSIEINTYYTYKEKDIPPVIQDIIHLCELSQGFVLREPITGNIVLYGPHLTRKLKGQMICNINNEYMDKIVEFKENTEDAKIKLFYKWLKSLLDILS